MVASGEPMGSSRENLTSLWTHAPKGLEPSNRSVLSIRDNSSNYAVLQRTNRLKQREMHSASSNGKTLETQAY